MAIDLLFSNILLCKEGGDLGFVREPSTFIEGFAMARLGQQASDSLKFSSRSAEGGLYQMGNVFENNDGINRVQGGWLGGSIGSGR